MNELSSETRKFLDTKYRKSTLSYLFFGCGHHPVLIKGVTGYIDSIQREDGSGRSFNITLKTDKGKKTVNIRTVD